MDPFLLLEGQPWLAPLVGIGVGLLLAVTPLAWPVAVTTVASAVATGPDRRGAVRVAAVVGAGVTLVYVVLGVGVGSIDWLVRDVLGAGAGVALALLAVLALLGGGTLLWRPGAACRIASHAPRGASAGGVALGAVLSAVTCPACAGIVTGVAVTAAAAAGPVAAATAMLGMGLGHTLALVVAVRVVTPSRVDPGRLVVAQRVAGVVLVVAGAAFAWQAVHTGLRVAPTLP